MESLILHPGRRVESQVNSTPQLEMFRVWPLPDTLPARLLRS